MGLFSKRVKLPTPLVSKDEAGLPSVVADNYTDKIVDDDYVAPSIDDLEVAATTSTIRTNAPAEEGGAAAGDAAAGDAAQDIEATAGATTDATTNASTDASTDATEDIEAANPVKTEALMAEVASVSKLLTQIEKEALEEGYVNADAEEVATAIEEEIDEFDGVKGTVQQPAYKDIFYAVLFVLHFGVSGWWFVESILHYNYYYSKFDHKALISFVGLTTLAGLGLSFVSFGYMLRHGETILKPTIALSVIMCMGVGVMGLCLEEIFVSICGVVGFVIVSMYANAIWKRIPFTAINISVAVSGIRENMGLFLGALAVMSVGFIPMYVCVSGAIRGHTLYGGWTYVASIFTYYWTQQVLTNVVAVATSAIIGRWCVIGDKTPNFTTGLKEILAMTRSYSFGSICYGSLFLGMISMLQGLSNFLHSKKGIGCLARLTDWILSKIRNKINNDANGFAYVYIGLYGYSFGDAGKNVSTMLQNKGWGDIVRYHMAGNILFMANMAIGLLTGFCGMIISTFQYNSLRKSGLANPGTDGFTVGFLLGFLVSSILWSVVTAAMNTMIVCLAESPEEFKYNHPRSAETLEKAWLKKENKIFGDDNHDTTNHDTTNHDTTTGPETSVAKPSGFFRNISFGSKKTSFGSKK